MQRNARVLSLAFCHLRFFGRPLPRFSRRDLSALISSASMAMDNLLVHANAKSKIGVGDVGKIPR